jgi:Uma2 family endonuclease
MSAMPVAQRMTLEGYMLMTLSRSVEGRGSVWLDLGIRLDERNLYQPDLLWYSSGREPDLDAPPSSRLPALAVEVRSPSTWRYDIGAKKAAYERHGLKELWLVDTAASEVLIFRRSTPQAPSFDVALELEREDALASPQLEGFELPLGQLFPE